MSGRAVAFVLVLVAGCAPVTARPKAAAAPPTRALDYRLTKQGDSVLVELRLAGDASGATTLELAPWGELENPGDFVLDFAATDEAGAVLPVTREQPQRWRVAHRPGAPLVVRYRLGPSPPPNNRQPSYYRPVVRPERFFALGYTALVTPHALDDDRPCTIALHWRGFADDGWIAVSSFGSGSDVTRVASLSALRDSVFYAGHLRLTTRPLRAGALQLVSDGALAVEDAALADAVARIVEVQRDFFGRRDAQPLLVTVLPLESPLGDDTNGSSLGGAFTLFLGKKVALAGPSRAPLLMLIAHEMFHQWTKDLARRDEPEGRSAWFIEGFTDFYARRSLVRAGLFDLADDVRELNGALAAFYLNPLRAEPNARIERDEWRDQDAQRLPYQRGDLAALVIDRELRARGSGLDDVMRSLVAAKTALDSGQLLQTLAAPASSGFAAKLRRIIVDGEVPLLPATLLAPCLTLTTRKLAPFALGFDGQALAGRHVILGLVADSPAARAGLRPGDVVRRMNVRRDATVPAELELADGRRVRFLPAGEPLDVPQVSIADAARCGDTR